MADKVKSALELALERASKMEEKSGTTPIHLTDEQKAEIAEIRRKYEAKIAEKEVMLQSKLREAVAKLPPPQAHAEVARLREELPKERHALEEERDNRIAAVHQQGKS